LRVLEDPDFKRGDIDIQWLERKLPSILGQPLPNAVERVAIIAAALLAERDRAVPSRSGSAHSNGAGDSAWTRLARLEGMRP
jgi:hypothetical protein